MLKDLFGNMHSQDIQKILDGFQESEVGKANGTKLAQIAIRRIIYQYDFDGNLIKIHKSLDECGKAMNSSNRGIQSVIDGYDNVNNKPAYSKGGFIFRDKPTIFTEQELEIIRKNSNCAEGKPEFGQYDLNWNLIKKFRRTNIAALEVYGLESARKSITYRLQGTQPNPFKSYNWKWIEDEE